MDDKEQHEDDEQAAQADEGQEPGTEPADEDASSILESDEHSDAPGPFGTGDE